MNPSRCFKLLRTLSLGLIIVAACAAHAQQPAAPTFGSFNVTPKPEDVKLKPEDANTLAGIRIRVKDAEGKPLARKRFYLLTKSVEEAALDWATVPVRDTYLKDASPELRAWLKKQTCDTLYCPEYEAEFASAKETVPELKRAYAEGLRKYKSEKLALRWMTVNFPVKELKTNYYEAKKAWLARAAQKAGMISSVMTDDRGDAYFIGVKPGSYFISNLIPLEGVQIVWSAPLSVPPLLPGKLHSVSVELNAKPK